MSRSIPLTRSLGILLLTVGLSACGIDSSQTNNSLGSVSIGQQLMDLKAAQEEGLLSEREYKTLRKKLLRTLSRSLAKEKDDDDRGDLDDDGDDEDEDSSWLF